MNSLHPHNTSSKDEVWDEKGQVPGSRWHGQDHASGQFNFQIILEGLIVSSYKKNHWNSEQHRIYCFSNFLKNMWAIISKYLLEKNFQNGHYPLSCINNHSIVKICFNNWIWAWVLSPVCQRSEKEHFRCWDRSWRQNTGSGMYLSGRAFAWGPCKYPKIKTKLKISI